MLQLETFYTIKINLASRLFYIVILFYNCYLFITLAFLLALFFVSILVLHF